MDQPAPHGERDIELERVVFFSDAIFAIAITLLVIDIRLPELPEGLNSAELARRVGELAPGILSFVIGFLVIASFWLAHRALFAQVRRSDARLLWLNLLFLLLIAFQPFPTAMIGRYGDTAYATIFYACTQIATSLALAALWLYAIAGGRLVSPPLSAARIRARALQLLATPLIFLLSIGIALRDPNLAKYSWLLLAIERPLAGFLMRADPVAEQTAVYSEGQETPPRAARVRKRRDR